MWPEKFSNKTNGITQRRWLLKSNPALSKRSPARSATGGSPTLPVEEARPLAGNSAFGESWRQVKRANKDRLAEIIRRQYQKRGGDLLIDPDSMFDVQ